VNKLFSESDQTDGGISHSAHDLVGSPRTAFRGKAHVVGSLVVCLIFFGSSGPINAPSRIRNR